MRPPSDRVSGEAEAAKQRESMARDADAQKYDVSVSPYHTLIELDALLGAIAARPGEIVLDLGAGTGRLTKALALRGATVIAVDISPASLELNRAKCMAVPNAAVDHLVVDVCRLPLRNGVAQKAVSGMMLEHIETHGERRRCIDEIYRVLQPRGRLALTAYNYAWSERRHGKREGFHGGMLYYYRFDRKELRQLLSPFEIRRVTGLLNLPQGVETPRLDRLIAAVPQLAGFMGCLLLAVADR